MSTKSTVSSSDDYHLYEKPFAKHTVYLQLDNCRELKIMNNYYGDKHERQVTIGIPAEIWEHIVGGWLKKNERK